MTEIPGQLSFDLHSVGKIPCRGDSHQTRTVLALTNTNLTKFKPVLDFLAEYDTGVINNG